MNDHHDPQAYARSMTGWEELAVAKAFGRGVDQLEGTMVPRALEFVRLRRAQPAQDAAGDRAAYRAAMDATLGALEAIWKPDPEDEPDDDQEDKHSPVSGPTSSSAPASPTPAPST